MQFLYSLIYTAAFVVALPYFVILGLIRGKYLPTMKQRFGNIPVSTEACVWIHAVSVGEFLAARPLIEAIRKEYPDLACLVSTTTITGQTLATKAYPGCAFYFPFDWRWSVGKVFDKIHPKLVVVLETEIWPNFLWEARSRNVPVILVNGRLSDRSYSRYHLVRKLLPGFDRCLMQSEESELRMKALGLCRGSIEVMGNLKFDFQPPSMNSEFKQRLIQWKGQDLLMIVGSTMQGEEETVLAWYENLKRSQSFKLMIAPRHPERFDEVEGLVKRRGLQLTKRSDEKSGNEPVFLLNSVGELAATYEFADLVFIGGTVGPFGGHNPIEPAYFGRAIVTGTSYSNFRAIYEEFLEQKAMIVSEHPERELERLLSSAEDRNALGQAAKRLVEKNKGATSAALECVRAYLDRDQSNPKLSV